MNRLYGQIKVFALGVSLVAALSQLAACNGSGVHDAGDADATCSTGNEGCVCWPNKTCNDPALSCLSMLCVSAPPGGGGTVPPGVGGGAGQPAASGGAAGAAVTSPGGAPGMGGAVVPPGTGGSSGGPGSTPGSGGIVTSGGALGTGGVSVHPGTGGATVPSGTGGVMVPPATGGAVSLGGTPGSGGQPSGGSGGGNSDGCASAASTVLDNFATCDTSICSLGGRNGTWFSYSSNTNIGIQCSATVPPVSWIDRGCAYYCTNGVAGATWAGVGFNLKDPSGAYDLSGYTGVYVRVETGQSLNVAITDLSGGTWRSPAIGGGSGAVTYTVPFSKMTADSGTSGYPNLEQIVGFRFDVDSKALSSFGFAIHTVTLY